MRYPGLDGVRAIAVLLVFSVHTIPQFTASIGWVGVQIFFVLSGFLITGILYDTRYEPHRWRNFITRRALRIFPLYYFVWIVIAVLTPLLRLEWHRLDALWLVYLGNYVNFAAGNESLIQLVSQNHDFSIRVGHFWSLAIEEQFYLLWPLVVFAVRDRGKLIRTAQYGILAVLGLRIALYCLSPAPLLHLALLNYLTFTQADAFFVGALMALWMRGPEWERIRAIGSPLLLSAGGAFIGIQAIAALFFHGRHNFNQTSPWISTFGFTLIDLTAAGFILCAMREGSTIYRLCCRPLLRRLGICSYGFYVYHQLLLPDVLAILPRAGRWHAAIDGLGIAAYFLLICGVSGLSYRYLETPFLRLKDRLSAPSNTWTVTVPE